jgi:hypothetical protein
MLHIYPSTTLPIKIKRLSVVPASGHADRTNPSDPDEYGIKGSDLFQDLFLCKPAYFWAVE